PIRCVPEGVRRVLIGISAEGSFATNDGGDSWRMYEAGIREYGKQNFPGREDISTCVHKMARDPTDPAVVYQQNHAGVFRRNRGDAKWSLMEKGLPIAKSTGGPFGFPMVSHPHDRGTA